MFQYKCLDVEAEMHDVAILHNIFLAFDAKLTSFANSSLRTVLQIVFIFDNFGTDKTLLEVGMDNTSTLWGLPSLVVSPSFYQENGHLRTIAHKYINGSFS